MNVHLARTPILDFDHPGIEALVVSRGWRDLPAFEAIGAIYSFVRDEIPFGYNASDELPASRVLADGYGQCNTKGTLLMALSRSVQVSCRFHGFTIDKRLQRGAITGIAYRMAPESIVHSWVEVLHEGRWINLEGFILDREYLDGVRAMFPKARGSFCGYGIGTEDIDDPPIEWCGRDTFIQRSGINRDYGVFDSPDAFYARHASNLSGLRAWLYANFVRHGINANVRRIRARSAKRGLRSSPRVARAST